MNLVRPRLITFDVSDTLLMTKLEHHYAEIGLMHGISVDSSKLLPSFKANFKRLSLEHPIYGKYTGLGWKKWWKTVVHNVFKEQNCDFNNETLDKVADSLIECYGTNKCWDKFPGAVEILQDLQKRGVILGVISNFDERLEPLLESTRLRSYFSFVLASYAFGAEKPNPEIFQEALKLSTKGRKEAKIAPCEALHIGDRVDNDYLGARTAGWNAILINRSEKPVDESLVCKNDVFNDLFELRRHFDDLLLQGVRQT